MSKLTPSWLTDRKEELDAWVDTCRRIDWRIGLEEQKKAGKEG